MWSRVIDTALSITDRQTLEINARIERWVLEPGPSPGKLVHQIVQWLYRENRLCRGTLKVSEILVGPSSLSVPALAIVTTADEVAPLASVKPFIDATPATGVRIIQYPGEVGVGLQQLFASTRTLVGASGASVMCHKRTFAKQRQGLQPLAAPGQSFIDDLTIRKERSHENVTSNRARSSSADFRRNCEPKSGYGFGVDFGGDLVHKRLPPNF